MSNSQVHYYLFAAAAPLALAAIFIGGYMEQAIYAVLSGFFIPLVISLIVGAAKERTPTQKDLTDLTISYIVILNILIYFCRLSIINYMKLRSNSQSGGSRYK
jgi:hypothetical protein